MSKWYQNWDVICHWCGKAYKSKKNRLQARFCSKACKQAHHRAYKKYVTTKLPAKLRTRKQRVTQK